MNLKEAFARREVFLDVLVLVLGVIILAFWFKSCDDKEGPKIDPKDQKTIDSLDRTKPEFDSTQRAIKVVLIKDTLRSAALEKEAKTARARASSAQRVADSLASVAAQSADSATAWHRAYDARTVEAVDLRNAYAKKDSAWQSEVSARHGLETLYANDTLRRVSLEKLNTNLIRTIGELERPCRIIGPIPCPSRTVAAAGGAIVGILVTGYIKR